MNDKAIPGWPAPAVAGRGPRVRIGLTDLIGWTLGAALVASVWRRVKPAEWLAPPIDVDGLLGMWAEAVAVFLGIGLWRQVVALARGRRAGNGPPIGAAVAWRLAAATLLALVFVAEAGLIGGAMDDLAPYRVTVRKRLLPIAATLAMAGIVAGLSPGRPSPATWGWPSMAWAGIAAVAIAAKESFVPYLVMISLQGIRDGLFHPELSVLVRPGLHDRILRAGMETIPALACWLLLALCLSRSLRRPAPRPGGEAEGWRAAPVLPAAAAGAALGGAWQLSVTIPRLDGCVAEGLREVVGPVEAAVTVLGLAGLAIGPAARAAGRPGRPDAGDAPAGPSALDVALKAALTLVLLDVITARALSATGLADRPWARWVGWADAALAGVRPVVPSPFNVWGADMPAVWLAVALVQAWLSWRVALLLVMPIDPGSIPIDAALRDRRASARLAVRWASLTVLMVASLPILPVVGLFVLHVLGRALG